MRKELRGVVTFLTVAVVSATATFVWAMTPVEVDVNEMWQPITENNKTTVYLPTFPSPVDLLKEEIHETKNWCDIGEDTTTQVSFEDAQILMKIAQSEAGVDGIDGMAAVMKVVLNRVESPDFPNTVEEVVTQSTKLDDGRVVYQFSPVDTGTYFKTTPNLQTHLALAELEKGSLDWLDALYFENAKNSWQEKNKEYTCTIGHHKFYK